MKRLLPLSLFLFALAPPAFAGYVKLTGIPLLDLGILLAVIALIFYVLWWALGKLALGDPFDKILRVILIIATVVVVVGLLVRAFF